MSLPVSVIHANRCSWEPISSVCSINESPSLTGRSNWLNWLAPGDEPDWTQKVGGPPGPLVSSLDPFPPAVHPSCLLVPCFLFAR